MNVLKIADTFLSASVYCIKISEGNVFFITFNEKTESAMKLEETDSNTNQLHVANCEIFGDFVSNRKENQAWKNESYVYPPLSLFKVRIEKSIHINDRLLSNTTIRIK